MKRLKTPERFILVLLLGGLCLGGAGWLLTRLTPPDNTGPACSNNPAGPGCGTPYRVVRYTLETGSAGPASATPTRPVQQVQAGPAAGRRLPVMAWLRVYPSSRLAAPNWPAVYGPAPTIPASPVRLAPAGRAGDTLRLPESAADLAKTAAGDELLAPPDRRLIPLAEQAAGPGTGAGAVQPARPDLPCPPSSPARFDLIPVEGPAADHADRSHGDLNLDLRGYSPAAEPAGLVDYNGPADPDAPQLAALFTPDRPAVLRAGYRVNQWIWDAGQCGGQAGGCPGQPVADWPVTVVGLASRPGEAIFSPRRRPEIYRGGYIALVLYASSTRLTLGYTRRDSVAAGYVVHLENLCVDPNLLSLYRAQNNPAGWRRSGYLPALRPGQALGVAMGDELRVAIRDNGNFLDPRSRKDWWQ